MSIPFCKTKGDAQSLWGKDAKLVKVYVEARRGFLQAPRDGYYWIRADYAKKLKLKKSR